MRQDFYLLLNIECGPRTAQAVKAKPKYRNIDKICKRNINKKYFN